MIECTTINAVCTMYVMYSVWVPHVGCMYSVEVTWFRMKGWCVDI